MTISFYLKKAENKHYVILSLYCSDGRLKKSMGAIKYAELFPDKLPKNIQGHINACKLRLEAYINTCIDGRLPVLKSRASEIIDIELKGTPKEKKSGLTISALMKKYETGIKNGSITNNGVRFSAASVSLCRSALRSLEMACFDGIDVAKFDNQAIERYKIYMINHTRKNGKKYTQNTISLYITSILTSLAHFYGTLHKNPVFKEIEKVGNEDVDNSVIYTIPELLELNKITFTGAKETVRDIFVYGCFIGFRQQDYIRHTEKNIADGVISLNTRKRNVAASIPVSPIIEKILDKYKGKPPKMEIHYFNVLIKKVCREAGFTNLVSYKRTEGGKKVEKLIPRCDLTSWHTMRRTCATNLLMGCVELGIPPIESEAVRKMLGWKSDTMIKKYNKAKPEDVAKEKITHPFFNIK